MGRKSGRGEVFCRMFRSHPRTNMEGHMQMQMEMPSVGSVSPENRKQAFVSRLSVRWVMGDGGWCLMCGNLLVQ